MIPVYSDCDVHGARFQPLVEHRAQPLCSADAHGSGISLGDLLCCQLISAAEPLSWQLHDFGQSAVEAHNPISGGSPRMSECDYYVSVFARRHSFRYLFNTVR